MLSRNLVSSTSELALDRRPTLNPSPTAFAAPLLMARLDPPYTSVPPAASTSWSPNVAYVHSLVSYMLLIRDFDAS